MMQKEVKNIIQDMQDLKIQGATNTAMAVMETLGRYVVDVKGDLERVKIDLEQTAYSLAKARATEPLARNAVRYVLAEVKDAITLEAIRDTVALRTQRFNDMLREAKAEIVKVGVKALDGTDLVLSHCHSSTAVGILKGIDHKIKKLTVITTETRPMFQGRKTAKTLLEANIDVVMIVDSAVATFLTDDTYLPIDVVLIGCDEFTAEGNAINKVGSLSIALAARDARKPLFIATPLLKAGTETLLSKPVIEKRPYQEIWKDAPKNLQIINQSFEVVPANLISGYITEEGVLKPSDVFRVATSTYSWLR